MDRRKFVSLSTGTLAALGANRTLALSDAQPEAALCEVDSLPLVEIEMTDDGFILPEKITAGLTRVSIVNTGTMGDSHLFMTKVADHVTEAQLNRIMDSEDGGGIDFVTDFTYVGAPDWPMPDGPAVTGIVTLEAGRNLIINLAEFDGRGLVVFDVEESETATCEPSADLTVELVDFVLKFPSNELAAGSARWRMENNGSLPHDITLIAVPEDFTEEMFFQLMEGEMQGTPTAEVTDVEYLPVAGIGILSPGKSSWLDVDLQPGKYLAVCMLPFGTGYPHAMEGMIALVHVS